MKESIEDITADIEYQYGKSNTEKNIEYILSLYRERLKDGVLDDNILVPSNEQQLRPFSLYSTDLNFHGKLSVRKDG